MAVCACRSLYNGGSRQKSQVMSFVKGERYRIAGRHTNWGGASYLSIGLVQKSDVGAWNSIRGETQTVNVKYDWHGDILKINLGAVSEGKYKLSWNLQPYDQALSYGATNAWIDIDENPAIALNAYANLRIPYELRVTATRGAHLDLMPAQHLCKADHNAWHQLR